MICLLSPSVSEVSVLCWLPVTSASPLLLSNVLDQVAAPVHMPGLLDSCLSDKFRLGLGEAWAITIPRLCVVGWAGIRGRVFLARLSLGERALAVSALSFRSAL